MPRARKRGGGGEPGIEVLFTDYWEAGDLRASLSDGDPISSWTGRNGIYTFTQSGSSRPVFIQGASQDLDVVDFDGIDDYLTCDPIASLFAAGTSQTIVEAFTGLTAGSSDFRYVFAAGLSSSTNTWIGDYVRLAIRAHYRRRNGEVKAASFSPDFAGDWTEDSIVEGATGGASRSLDVDQYSSGNAVSPGGSISDTITNETSPDTFSWGCRRVAGTNTGFFYEGNSYAFGVVDRIWTTEERAQWTQYCIDKGWA